MILRGNCRETLKSVPDNSIDAVVTDPPYDLVSVTKRWGGENVRNTPAMDTDKGGVYSRSVGGFLGHTWDGTGIAFDPEFWLEVARVLKPGGHLLAFGGTRTYHRMAVAIEDAGFEVRDSIHWAYGSGFPKSFDIGKSIDKHFNAEREVVGYRTAGISVPGEDKASRHAVGGSHAALVEVTVPTTTEAKQWTGWGTALKPAHEPIIVARKPFKGTAVKNVLETGVGALNIEGCRVGEGENGRWPANFVLTHNSGCRQIGTREDTFLVNVDFTEQLQAEGWGTNRAVTSPATTSIPLWQCVGDCPVLLLAQQGKLEGDPSRYFTQTEYEDEADFPPFLYYAKPSNAERNAGLDGFEAKKADQRSEKAAGMWKEPPKANFHPTVKPVSLMRHLVRLVTPPGGTVLDPFLGSGTTAVAAILEGKKWVGCEMTEDYWPIIEGRTAWAERQNEGRLFTDEGM